MIYRELIPPDVIAALINIDTKDQDSGTSFFRYGTKNYQLNWIKMKHGEGE